MPDASPAADVHPPKPKPGAAVLRIVWWAAIVLLAIGVASAFWTDSPMGRSMPNLVQQSALLLAAICGIVWFVFGAGVIRGVVPQLLTMAIVVALPFLLIERIELTGDMNVLVHWRGSKTQEERLKEFAAKQPAQAQAEENDEDKTFVIGPHDMPSFNGPKYDGRAPGPALLTNWESNPPVKLWERPVGAGYAGVAIVDDRIVTLEQRDNEETQTFEEWITCYDLATGSEIWHHAYPASFYEEAGGRGPRSTPLITEDGKVYTTGAVGDVCCVNLADGSLNWQVNVLREHDVNNVQWGIASSPLMWGELLIVNVGGPKYKGQGLVALDHGTGDEVWAGPGLSVPRGEGYENRAGYSTPMIATIDGVELIIHLDGDRLCGYLPETGEIVWSYEFRNDPGVNVAQPIVFDDGRVFITCSYGVGSRMLKVSQTRDEWNVTELWGNTRMRCKFCSPIHIDGYIYGLNEGRLACLDAETGNRQWQQSGRYGHGQMLLRGEHLVVFTESGEVALVRPNPEEFEELALLPVFDRDKNWNPPGLAGDILVVRNHFDMAAFRLPVE